MFCICYTSKRGAMFTLIASKVGKTIGQKVSFSILSLKNELHSNRNLTPPPLKLPSGQPFLIP